jgi:hypothetical protein
MKSLGENYVIVCEWLSGDHFLLNSKGGLGSTFFYVTIL